MDDAKSLSVLREPLLRLSLPSAGQVEYLTAIGISGLVDELALEFDDVYRHRAAALRAAFPRTSKACRRVDEMLQNPALGWSFSDLDSDDWNHIREQARTALIAFDDEVGQFAQE